MSKTLLVDLPDDQSFTVQEFVDMQRKHIVTRSRLLQVMPEWMLFFWMCLHKPLISDEEMIYPTHAGQNGNLVDISKCNIRFHFVYVGRR